MKRSEGKGGRIPHLGVMRERADELVVIDYIPRQRKSGLFDQGQFFLLFDGLVRVRVYEEVGIGIGDTVAEARRALNRRK
jgi:hypothetical protein